MTRFTTIRLERDERGIARLTLARPEKHNALNEAMMRDVLAACDAIEADPEVRAVVLAAEGTSFCAGGDLAWMRDQAARDRAGKMEGASLLSDMLRRLDELPMPLIARVQGPAYGGGVGMMAVADIVLAAERVQFALTEARLGLIPATIGPYVVRRIGEGAARRAVLNARQLGPEEAMRIGLVSEVVAPERLDDAVAEEAAAALACAPGAVAQSKALIRMLARGESADPIAQSALALADRWESEEARAGIAAFLARQKMPWA